VNRSGLRVVAGRVRQELVVVVTYCKVDTNGVVGAQEARLEVRQERQMARAWQRKAGPRRQGPGARS
jgi:hypothetical protein